LTPYQIKYSLSIKFILFDKAGFVVELSYLPNSISPVYGGSMTYKGTFLGIENSTLAMQYVNGNIEHHRYSAPERHENFAQIQGGS